MRLLILITVVAVCSSWAQLSAADTNHACHEWETEVARLKVEVAAAVQQASDAAHELTTQRDLVRQYEEYSAKLREQADADKAGLAAVQQQASSLQEQLKGEQEVRTSAENRLKAVQEQLLSAESRASEGQRAELSTDERALLKLVQDSWLPLWAQRRLSSSRSDLNVLYEELKSGNTSRYGLLAYQAYQGLERQASTASSFVSQKLDDHAPGVKAQLLKTVASLRPHATTAWEGLDKNVLKAQWFREVQQRLVQAEGELRTFLTHSLTKIPFLAPYADPVLIQAVVYALFAAPVLLVLFPVLLGLLSLRRTRPEVDAALKKKSAKKGRTSSTSSRATPAKVPK